MNPIDMRLVSIYELTQEQFLKLAQAPKIAQFNPKSPNNSKLSLTSREGIEGNIENRNCYCIPIDYDDDNEEEEEEEEEGEDRVQGT